MERINLDKKYIDFIINTISEINPDIEIYIFGSRTQNRAREYSDIDIALKSINSIPIDIILKLKTIFQDSTLPYKVDIIDINSIEEYFYNLIKNDLVRIK